MKKSLPKTLITEQQQIEAEHFRRKAKAQIALNGETIKALAKRIGYPAGTVTAALRRPWDTPNVVTAIEADLFGKKHVGSREEVAK
ncbi:MAG TPA: hypothetical protein VNQ90_17820 [Chthoniobacteraceae bacterium]|nr:hypothetical protein [Chthoniobacteraceae bacterium]